MNETAGDYQPPIRTPVDLPDQEPVSGEEKEQTWLRVAVVAAVVILVLFGLYWGGKLLLMPGEEKAPAGPEGVEVAVESKCNDPTTYTDIMVALGNAKSVCKIDVSGQGLTELSSYIGHYSNLVELNISNNKISDLPSQVGWLVRLEKFDASDNNLLSLRSEIGWMQELKEWNLSNNQLSAIPLEIGWLRKMEYFNLANNRLTGLPREMGWMAQMKTLDLSGNLPEVAGSVGYLRQYMPGANIILP